MNEELIKEMVKVKKRKEKLEKELGLLQAMEELISEDLNTFFEQKFIKELHEEISVNYFDGYIIVNQYTWNEDNEPIIKEYKIDFNLKNLKEIANVNSVEEFYDKLKKYRFN